MNFDSLSFGEYWRPVSLSYNDLLGVALDLYVSRLVLVDVEQRSGVVGDEHGQRLRGPARRPDRTGVVDVDEFGAVVVFQQLDPVDPLDRRGDDPGEQQRDRGPDRAFDLAGPGVVVADGPLDEVGDEFEGRLLAGHLAFQLADSSATPPSIPRMFSTRSAISRAIGISIFGFGS